jgi:hypothetical protein
MCLSLIQGALPNAFAHRSSLPHIRTYKPDARHEFQRKETTTDFKKIKEANWLTAEQGWLGGIAQHYGLDDRGFESRQGLKIFLFTTASRPVLGPTQPPIQWIPGALSLG